MLICPDTDTGLAEVFTTETGVFTIPGIGKLVLSKRKVRMGRNPPTGEAIKIPAKTVVKLRVAKGLKRQLYRGRSKRRRLHKEETGRNKPKGNTLWGASLQVS